MAKQTSILINLLDWHPKMIRRLLDNYSDLDEVLEASPSRLMRDAGIDAKSIEQLLRMKDSRQFRRELKLIRDEAIDCIDIFDKDYPELLRQIDNPPLVLYVRGDVQALSGILFAVVGSRKPSRYGIRMAEWFSSKLASLGVIVVSGLARGIDSVAHRAAIKRGMSVAVLGSGLLNVYPSDNKKLAVDIARRGALISEFPLLQEPRKENFPRRNRLVSGLCKGVLVVEAASRSGALITAHLAAEQNREVFSIPGNIDSNLSKGANTLIKEGAQPVDCPEDILDALALSFKKETIPVYG